jgi:hypothetical protein
MIRTERGSVSARKFSDSDDDVERDISFGSLAGARPVSNKAAVGKLDNGSDYLRLDNYEIGREDAGGDLLVADEEFFREQRTPSRSRNSNSLPQSASRVGEPQQVAAVDRTPIMLMKQMNRLSVPVMFVFFRSLLVGATSRVCSQTPALVVLVTTQPPPDTPTTTPTIIATTPITTTTLATMTTTKIYNRPWSAPCQANPTAIPVWGAGNQ